MVSFNDLPNEIIYSLIKYLHLGDPADLANLSLVCKTLHALSEPGLEADYHFKQAYVSFRKNARNHTSVENVMLAVLHDPRAVFMIERLYVVDLPFDWIRNDPIGTVKHVMKNSGLIPEDQQHHLLKSLRKGDRDSILARLLTLLPNITCLLMEGSFHDGSAVMETLQSIARQSSGKVLSKLSEVNILPLPAVGEEPYITSFELLQSFATLPSVKTLTSEQMMDFDSAILDAENFVVAMKDSSDEENDEPTRPSRSFNLTTLNLRSSLIPTKTLTRFLEKCTALENFEYTPAYFPLDPGEKCLDYIWLNDSLLKATKSSLKSLKLLLHFQHKTNLMPIVSLRRFEVLCHIDVDMAILTGLQSNSSSATEFPLLSELLPASVQRLSLTHHQGLEMSFIQRLVQDLISTKAHNLPLLKKLEIHLIFGRDDEPLSPQDDDIIQSCVISCLEIGLSLSVTQLWAYF